MSILKLKLQVEFRMKENMHDYESMESNLFFGKEVQSVGVAIYLSENER